MGTFSKAALRPPNPGRPGPFHALRYRNFRLFFIGQLISVAGTWMQVIAQNWLVWQLTQSKAWLGIVTGAGAIPFLSFTLLGGQIADTYPRRSILMITQLLPMLLAFGLAWLDSRFAPIPIQPWMLAVVSALNGLVVAFNMPAQQAFVREMVDNREALGNAIALNSLRFNIARSLGPLLAGLVLVRYGPAPCFLLNGLSFLAVLYSLQQMKLPPHVAPKTRSRIREGFAYIRKTPSTLQIMALVMASSIFIWPISTLFPALAKQFQGGAAHYSALMIANGAGATIAAFTLAAVSSRLGKLKIVYASALLAIAAIVLVALAPMFGLLVASAALMGFATVLFGIGAQIRVQETVPDTLRGRVMALYTMLANGRYSIGGLEIGLLAEYTSSSAAIVLNALISFLVVAAAWIGFSRMARREPVLPEQE